MKSGSKEVNSDRRRLLHSPNGEKPFLLSDPISKGLEHEVFLRGDGVLKIPRPWMSRWNRMELETAEEDRDMLDEFEIKRVPTQILGGYEIQDLDTLEQLRQRLSYVLKQPYIYPSREMSYGDLLHFDRYRLDLLELMRRAEGLFAKYDRGVDLLGGVSYADIPSALNSSVETMETTVANLLIPSAEAWDQYDNPDFGEGCVDFFVEPLLCDVRLHNYDHGDSKIGRLHSWSLRQVHHFQYGILWTLLEDLGIEPDIDFETRAGRMGRNLAYLAIPKLRKAAETEG